MDKRWRNLGVILLLLIIIAAGYYLYSNNYLNQFIPGQFLQQSQTKITLNDGYFDLQVIFEKNDVNIIHLQQLQAVNISYDGAIVWVEKKASLLSLKSDLVKFSKDAKAKYADSNELVAISNLYIDIIDYSLRNESRFNKISAVVSKEGLSCSNYGTMLVDINSSVNEIYVDAYALDLKSLAFSMNYDLLSDPVAVDLSAYYDETVVVNSLIMDIDTYCKGEL